MNAVELPYVGLQGLQLPSPCLKALLRGYLSPTDRLCLFKVSKGLASAIMQHAGWDCLEPSAQMWDMLLPGEQVQLKADRRSADEALSRGTKTVSGVQLVFDEQQEQGFSKQQLQARGRTLQRLLAAAPRARLHVVLRNGISAMWVYLPGRQISKLTLEDAHLPAHMDTILPLLQCSKLETLRISNSHNFTTQHSDVVSALSKQQRAAFHAPALGRMEVHGDKAWAALRTWALLLGKQVTFLATILEQEVASADDGIQALLTIAERPHRIPPTMSALACVHMDTLISDQLLDDLAALPRLAHVVAAGIALQRCHLRKQLRWHLFLHPRLWDGAYFSGLQHVNLQQMRCFWTVQSVRPCTEQDAMQLADQLSLHPDARCAWSKFSKQQRTLCMLGHYTAQLLLACTRAIKENWCGLLLGGFSGPRPDLLPAFSSLPVCVHGLCFSCNLAESQWPQTDSGQEQHFIQQVARAVPMHLRGIYLSMPHAVSKACTWAAALVTELAAASKAHIMVVVDHQRFAGPWPSAPILQLAKAHSGKVYAICYAETSPSNGKAVKLLHQDGNFSYTPVALKELHYR